MSCGATHSLELPREANKAQLLEFEYPCRSNAELEIARTEAIQAGIYYINSHGHNRKTFQKFGGDIIFLLRNLVHSVGLDGDSTCRVNTEASLEAADCFVSLLRRWLAEFAQTSCEMEMEEILNLVEALHTLDQLGIKGDTDLPTKAEVVAKLTTINHPITSTSRIQGGSNIRVNSSCEQRKTRGSQAPKCSASQIKRHVQDAIVHFDITDMLGYDPTTHQVPLTESKHCAHCLIHCTHY